ncbi:MAG TPA: hypothetical protein VH475_10195 [Tepidisphaeraceae bacterium]|jgi:hypothetical protein
MKNLQQIKVPVRFGVYAVLGGAGAWLAQSELFLAVYATAMIAVVVWYWRSGTCTEIRR